MITISVIVLKFQRQNNGIWTKYFLEYNSAESFIRLALNGTPSIVSIGIFFTVIVFSLTAFLFIGVFILVVTILPQTLRWFQ